MPIRYRPLLLIAIALVSIFSVIGLSRVRRWHRVLIDPQPRSRSLVPPSEEALVATPTVESIRAFFIGHSLVGHRMPMILEALGQSLGATMECRAQWLDGASIKANWERHAETKWGDAVAELPRAEPAWDTLVLTEAVNLDDHIRWSDPEEYGSRFVELARTGGRDPRILFYIGWHDRKLPRPILDVFTRGDDWRTRLDRDLGLWEWIVDGIEERTGAAIDVIPVGPALGRLVDLIRGGEVPGIADEAALFDDDIHPSALGEYFVACVHCAVLLRRSPVGATASPEGADGPIVVLDEATARTLQAVAWQAVRAYPRAFATLGR